MLVYPFSEETWRRPAERGRNVTLGHLDGPGRELRLAIAAMPVDARDKEDAVGGTGAVGIGSPLVAGFVMLHVFQNQRNHPTSSVFPRLAESADGATLKIRLPK